ncbi:polysaccharide biosynthesis/export family protein [Pseudacidobacterium ailaaui]|uniref:polysaccharide biosynthesis/export family protein n=1 Tax=Pseudacidobacterium ailaaui TaxID=1382359 RepID=UPI00047CCAFC|nr:polysaccharide biosynthesis/export family protein [Pseudacidobacterium ailaaui]
MMRIVSLWLVMLLCVACGYAQDESIKIGPADLIHIKVLEAPELEQSVRVTDSGNVSLMVGGEVKVAGLTPAEAALAIRDQLIKKGYFLNPHVTVLIDQPATQNVTIMGQVHSPGSYPIGTPRSVVEVLAMAGGITDLADRNITIERRSTKEKIKYFYSNQSSKALDTSVYVYPGDIVNVPKAEIVYVLGDVGRPGGFPMTTNDSKLSVLQAVSLAGGTQPSAVPSSTKLIRKGPNGEYVVIKLPLSAMQKGRHSDFQLQADDIIYVPFSYTRNIAVNINSLLAAAASASVYRF